MVVQHVKQFERVKKLNKWMPHALTKNLKKKKLSWSVADTVLKCHLFLLYTTTKNHFSTELWCAWKSKWYGVTGKRPVQWLDQKAAPKHFPKLNLHPKRLQSVLGRLLPVWSTTAFWILAKPLYLRIMLSKRLRCTEKCNACSQH